LAKSIEHINKELQHLTGYTLSIYLNTSPDREDWRIRLKNGLKRMKEYITASNPEQAKNFTKISKRVEKAIRDHQTSLSNSLVCFVSDGHMNMYHLQIPVENDFQWKKGPATEQLQAKFDEYPKCGVVLLQNNKVTLITSVLGELIHEMHYEIDLETNNWKEYKGTASGNIYSGGANHREKFNRRLKENQARWYRQIVPTINRFARQQQWQSVHLAGPAELTKTMRNLLSIKVNGETTRNYSGKSAHAILNRTILASSS